MEYFHSIPEKLSRTFEKLGRHVASYPKWTIILSALSSLFLGLGMIKLQFLTDIEFIFSPLNCRSYEEQRTINELFPMNTSYNFDFLRNVYRGRFALFIVTTKDRRTVLRKSVFGEIVDLDKLVRSFKVTWKGGTYTYNDICAKNDGECYINEALNYFDQISQVGENETVIRYPIEVDLSKLTVKPTCINFGGVKTDQTKMIIEAKAIRLLYWLQNSSDELNELSQKWDEELRKQLQKHEFNITAFSMVTSSDYDILTWKFIVCSLIYGNIGMAIIIIFCIISSMTSDWITSKPTLAIAGCTSAGFAALASTGVMCALGVSLTNVNLSLVFLIIGIAVDDMFILIATWRITDSKDSVINRLGDTYYRAAMPIIMTSLTNFIAFAFGATIPIYAVRFFCLHGMLAVMLDMIYQLTFFGGCMALDGYREEKNLHPLVFKPVILTKEAGHRSRLYQILFTRKSESSEKKPPLLMMWFRNRLSNWISKKEGKTAILIVFLLYLAGASYGIKSLKRGLQLKDVFFPDSKAYRYIPESNRYFNQYMYPVQIAFNATLDYSNQRVRREISKMMYRLHRTNPTASYEVNWLKQYLFLTKFNKTYSSYNISDPKDFISCLRKEFFNHPSGRQFRNDVQFHEDGKHITSSRFILFYEGSEDIIKTANTMTQMRSVADSLPYSVTVQSFWWIMSELSLVIDRLCIQSIGVTIASICLVLFLLSAHLPSTIIVTINIISIEFGLVGYMSLLGITLSAVSTVVIILAVGLSVDPCTHISYAYKESGGTYQQRIQNALFSAGVPILQGSLSTILSVSAIFLMNHYIFRVFVIIVYLVVVISFFHAIFILPLFFGFWDNVEQIFKKLKSTKSWSPPIPQSTNAVIPTHTSHI